MKQHRNSEVLYGHNLIPQGIRSRLIEDVNGLKMHILEAGYDGASDKPCIVMLHGFPELAFSFRHQLAALAGAGYYVIAPDQRGYGLTTGWDGNYDGDVGSFRMFNLVQDIVSLLTRLGLKSISGIVGHDFGSPVAAWCSLIRPDIFKSLVLMSAPFGGPPSLSGSVNSRGRPLSMDESLASLKPARIHYQAYYSRRYANEQLLGCASGLLEFFKGYYFLKSAGYSGNRPFPLAGWSATELAKLPRYYVMDIDTSMPQTVASMMGDMMKTPDWLTEDLMLVYASVYQSTGFQGGLNWYRCSISAALNHDLKMFTGRKIEVPAAFIAGEADWGIHQSPGQLDKMQNLGCTNMTILPFVEQAGHWVQQEQPDLVNNLLLQFFAR